MRFNKAHLLQQVGFDSHRPIPRTYTRTTNPRISSPATVSAAKSIAKVNRYRRLAAGGSPPYLAPTQSNGPSE